MERVKLNNTVDLKQLQKAHMKFGCFFRFCFADCKCPETKREDKLMGDKPREG